MPNHLLHDLIVRPVQRHERGQWEALMESHHYLGFSPCLGESLRYVAQVGKRWVALMGWSWPALKCASRDTWIGWRADQRQVRLRFLANNNRFLILPGVEIRNLASRILSLNLRRLSLDWFCCFGHRLLLVETFVDGRRFQGSCYRGAGWLCVGQTRGFGRRRGGYENHGCVKRVFLKPLVPQADAILSQEFPHPYLTTKEVPVGIEMNRLLEASPGNLLEVLGQIPDHRKRRGIRHCALSLLLLSVGASLSGARSYQAICDWGQHLSKKALQKLGFRQGQAPSEPTLRRFLQSVDVEQVDRWVGQWLSQQGSKNRVGGALRAVAVDGKTLRGAWKNDPLTMPHLLSALDHAEGVVLHQRSVGQVMKEHTSVKSLLEPLDLTQTVVTLDALHTRKERARFLVEDKKAHYLMTVKANAKALQKAIRRLPETAFSP